MNRPASPGLDLADIQGNIHRPYGRFGFPHTRHLFFNIADAAAARRFVHSIRARVTTAEPWDATLPKPQITLNIGFTFFGLYALDLPTATLRQLPDEFIDGMGSRAEILGDTGDSAPERWDSIWHYGPRDRARQVHVWISLNAGAKPDGTPLDVLGAWTEWLLALAENSTGGVTLLRGHGTNGESGWQDSAALMTEEPDGTRQPVPFEHFGFMDGISDPVFRGQFDQAAEALASIGGGKIAEGKFDSDTSWSPLATGEFILGQVDEGQEFPVATQPAAFARNGTFMVWRKLRQDVDGFEAEMHRLAALWKTVNGSADDEEAYQTVCAKIVGRWKSGLPLLAAPDWAAHQRLMAEWGDCLGPTIRTKREDAPGKERLDAFRRMLTGFRYGDDLDGTKCPFGAHMRRANPRDMLDPLLDATNGASTLTNRRRLLRRGLPYKDSESERGVVFMGVCASLFRQFEFIQQQWMNYGLDFEAGNDTCPLIGNRAQATKHVIPGNAPMIASPLPQFVATRGGDYFFVPSLNALRMIAMGTVDPT